MPQLQKQQMLHGRLCHEGDNQKCTSVLEEVVLSGGGALGNKKRIGTIRAVNVKTQSDVRECRTVQHLKYSRKWYKAAV